MTTAIDPFVDNTHLPVDGAPFTPKGRGYMRSVIQELARTFYLGRGTRASVRFGWDVVAILFDDQLAVRLPRSASAWVKMQKEEIVLGKIAAILPCPVPRPQIMTAPYRLSVHQMIPGRNLSRSAYRCSSRAKKEHLAEQLAELFVALHAIPPSLFGFGIPLSGTDITLTDVLERIGSEQKWRRLQYLAVPLKRGFARWLHNDQAVFSHFDLHGSNILIEETTLSISGILDFLDCGTGSRFYDLSKVGKIDVDLLERVWRIYRNRTQLAEDLIHLIAAYGILEQLSDILVREIPTQKATRRLTRVQKLVELLRD